MFWPPLLFALYSVLFLASKTDPAPSRVELAGAAVAVVIVAIVLSTIMSRLVPDRRLGVQFVSAMIVLFFSYGHFSFVMSRMVWGNAALGRDRYVLSVMAGALVASASLMWALRRHAAQTTRALTLVSTLLIAQAAWSMVGVEAAPGRDPARPDATTPTRVRERPNIYYIILDGYADLETLKEAFGYDNSAFVDFLHEQGFWVGNNTHSNYAVSMLSLAATLNMSYLEEMGVQFGGASTTLSVPNQLIRHPRVADVFRSLGYRLVHVTSGWGPTAIGDYADVRIQAGGLSPYVSTLIQNSLLGVVTHRWPMFSRDARQRVLNEFEALRTVHERPGPLFVFSHIVSPHPPAIFDRNGGPRAGWPPTGSGSGWDDNAGYLEQLIFVTSKIRQAISEIRSTDPEAIVILQSDHGPATNSLWDLSDGRFIRHRMRTLSAMRVPGAIPAVLDDSMTSVNTFRWLLTNYFKIPTPPLPDRVYYSNYRQPLVVHQATPIELGPTATGG